MSGDSGILVTLKLSDTERHILRQLPGLVRRHLESQDPSGRYAVRLFPKMAEDRAVDRELRKMLTDDVRERKLEQLKTFEESLASVDTGRISLTPDQAEHWLAFLTDLRVTLAVALGIEREDWYTRRDPRTPMSREELLFHYAGHLQSVILERGMGLEQGASWGTKSGGG